MCFSKTLRVSSILLGALGATGAQAERIYGITTADGISGANLVYFDTTSATVSTSVGALSGVLAGQSVRAIDFRPSSGMLYALSTSTTVENNIAQLYTVNLTTGALTTVGAAFQMDAGGSTRISMDFNPVADALRVVTGAGGNYRVNANLGGLLGTDTALNGVANAVIADVAYSNNVAGATSTTLYGYNFTDDSIVRIGNPSPNDGITTTVGSARLPLGSFSSTAGIGFDISGATGTAYVSLDNQSTATDNDEIYVVDLATGRLTPLVPGENGLARELDVDLLDISVAPQAVPEPATLAVLGLSALAVARRRRR